MPAPAMRNNPFRQLAMLARHQLYTKTHLGSVPLRGDHGQIRRPRKRWILSNAMYRMRRQVTKRNARAFRRGWSRERKANGSFHVPLWVDCGPQFILNADAY